MLHKLPIIGVMGASKARHDELTQPLGSAIAKAGYHLLTGGGTGVMEAVSQSFTATQPRKGLCIGVIPMSGVGDAYKVMPDYPNPYVELPIQSHLGIYDGHDPQQISRNYINILTSHVVVICPGSKGTRNELSLAQQFKKPFILFGNEAQFAEFPSGLRRTDDLHQVMLYIQNNLSLS
ncbi:MAG: DNA-binding protein [Alphaproteobacteria bacterium]|nr:DNA-binding protein [Alphaproteobacteria bacterium]